MHSDLDMIMGRSEHLKYGEPAIVLPLVIALVYDSTRTKGRLVLKYQIFKMRVVGLSILGLVFSHQTDHRVDPNCP